MGRGIIIIYTVLGRDCLCAVFLDKILGWLLVLVEENVLALKNSFPILFTHTPYAQIDTILVKTHGDTHTHTHTHTCTGIEIHMHKQWLVRSVWSTFACIVLRFNPHRTANPDIYNDGGLGMSSKLILKFNIHSVAAERAQFNYCTLVEVGVGGVGGNMIDGKLS